MRSKETWLGCDRGGCNFRVFIPETMDAGSESPDVDWGKAHGPDGAMLDLCPSCAKELADWWAA